MIWFSRDERSAGARFNSPIGKISKFFWGDIQISQRFCEACLRSRLPAERTGDARTRAVGHLVRAHPREAGVLDLEEPGAGSTGGTHGRRSGETIGNICELSYQLVFKVIFF